MRLTSKGYELQGSCNSLLHIPITVTKCLCAIATYIFLQVIGRSPDLLILFMDALVDIVQTMVG